MNTFSEKEVFARVKAKNGALVGVEGVIDNSGGLSQVNEFSLNYMDSDGKSITETYERIVDEWMLKEKR